MEYTINFLTVFKDAVCWDDIYNKLIDYHRDNFGRVGKDFEQFAKLYFQCEPSVCAEFKNVWLFGDTPLKIKEKLVLGNQDYGVDLILEDHEGHLFVVQCKFKQDQSALVSWTKDKFRYLLFL